MLALVMLTRKLLVLSYFLLTFNFISFLDFSNPSSCSLLVTHWFAMLDIVRDTTVNRGHRLSETSTLFPLCAGLAGVGSLRRKSTGYLNP